MFAVGVLTIPAALAALGAVPGALNVLGWCALNTYMGVIMGDFRNRHAGCHSIADMAEVVGGVWLREAVGALFIIEWVVIASSGLVGAATALNALSDHAICTVLFVLIVTAVVAGGASIRKFEHLGWVTWVGFASIYAAVLIIVIGVTFRDRPAAAPQTGPFELGYVAIGAPTFVQGINAASSIFVSSCGTTAFLPVISEMKNPHDYKKALYCCMLIVTSSYLCFSLVVYRWCGVWVATPSLGSAGPTLKKVAYGVGLFGLLVTGMLYVHVAAKYLFVRILKHSKHLQKDSAVHWITWLSCSIGLTAIAFVIAEGIPIFNQILSLAGSFAAAPLTICLPGYLYLHDYKTYRKGTFVQMSKYWFHWLLIAIGAFLCVGGTYGVIASIVDDYASGNISSAFSCADNSGSTH